MQCSGVVWCGVVWYGVVWSGGGALVEDQRGSKLRADASAKDHERTDEPTELALESREY